MAPQQPLKVVLLRNTISYDSRTDPIAVVYLFCAFVNETKAAQHPLEITKSFILKGFNQINFESKSNF